MSKRLVFASTLLIVVTTLIGCGSSSDSNDSAPAPAPVAVASVSDLESELADCVKSFKANMKEDPPSLDGRIAIGAAGNLPATHIGVVVFKNGAYSDTWIADNSQDAVETAAALNEAEAESEGVAEVSAAYSNGRVVSAPGNTEEFGELDIDKEAGGLEECIKKLN